MNVYLSKLIYYVLSFANLLIGILMAVKVIPVNYVSILILSLYVSIHLFILGKNKGSLD
ncbi:MAG TPA: hypothetical protein VIK94_03185 [Bacilli bacterium]